MATVEIMPHAELHAQKPAGSQTRSWYKDAIIYQVHVRAFHDSNGDGIGDLRGLTERLDYVQDLGVTALWLQPFFPSPLKDDGYDIADYMSVNPQYGTLDDFSELLDEAHRRELKVITELVMNHTSDQHEWFQRSRRAAPGSLLRDWYVWSDTPDKYQEARIIFKDFETSNWSWDAVAGAYFWHRFYSHQPDLNFDNPEVRDAMFEVLDFWLSLGVDGLRLDAVPYLFEREGTNCENLPETHAFLRSVRAHIDENFDDRMLLAEANQWPEDAAAYFGAGDECHMNFHFPLMPRLFMAVEREDRSPVVDILEQTPQLPPACQWATFLRNHDELTLEMVTDEERDYMYRTYAVDAKARINLGIRRRLAPLMGNNRQKMELMNALLLSLPGTPIVYYGDEIGMGDNYYLGDRNGVRTPMQWSADRNAGFSRANPQSLFLPVIIDPEYHYEFRNVEVQHANSHSLLWWTRRILDLRKQYSAFGHGSFTALHASNPKVLAFFRETGNETILVVANLSRLSQFVELDLSQHRGRTPVELFGQTAFPTIGEQPYLLSLGPHAFFWFCIGCQDKTTIENAPKELPTYRVHNDWRELLVGRGRKVLGAALENFLQDQRWFAGKSRTLQRVEIIDGFDLDPSSAVPLRLLVASATYAEGEPDTYVVPIALLDKKSADELQNLHPLSALMRIEIMADNRSLMLCEATWGERLWPALLSSITNRRKLRGQHGTLSGIRTEAFARWDDAPVAELSHTVLAGEQSNTSAAFDERFILKLFRRVTTGVNPELELGRQLTERDPLPFVPQTLGAMEYVAEAGASTTIAVLTEFRANVGDMWTYTLDELSRFFERAQSLQTAELNSPGAALANRLQLAENVPPPLAQETIGGYLYWAELLGRRIGELHVALSKVEVAAFAPEPFTRLYQRGLYQSMRGQVRATLNMLRAARHRLSEHDQALAEDLLEHERTPVSKFSDLLSGLIDAQRIRCHGDLYLGQVLFTGKDFVVIDFEGDAARPVSERRIKASPLRDVAGMLRSFHSVAHTAVRKQASTHMSSHASPTADEWATFWSTWASASFLKGYLAEARSGSFLPADSARLGILLTAYLLEKAVAELRFELINHPDRANVPLEAIRQICGDFAEPSGAQLPIAP